MTVKQLFHEKDSPTPYNFEDRNPRMQFIDSGLDLTLIDVDRVGDTRSKQKDMKLQLPLNLGQ